MNGDKFIHIHHSVPAVSVNSTYKDPNGDEIEVLPNVKDLGLTMSSDCYFEEHIENLCQNCSKISSWVLRTFHNRSKLVMLTLWKSLILNRIDNCSQLWIPKNKPSLMFIQRNKKSGIFQF